MKKEVAAGKIERERISERITEKMLSILKKKKQKETPTKGRERKRK